VAVPCGTPVCRPGLTLHQIKMGTHMGVPLPANLFNLNPYTKSPGSLRGFLSFKAGFKPLLSIAYFSYFISDILL
jgi:hypothetical protein